MKYLLTALILQLMSLSAIAGNASNIFSDGVFGAKWGESKEEVIKALPGGKESNDFGIVTYEIKDGRALFGIERNSKDYIKFTFDSDEKLMGVSVQFPLKSADDYGALLIKLNTTFGQSESVPNSIGVNLVRWPEDNGVTIGLLHIPGALSIGELLFTIEHIKKTAPVSKGDLGF